MKIETVSWADYSKDVRVNVLPSSTLQSFKIDKIFNNKYKYKTEKSNKKVFLIFNS